MNTDYLTAQVTFVYFEDIKTAAEFFEGALGLERVYDIGWCYIWRTAEKAFIGACDRKHANLGYGSKDTVMISLSVKDAEEVKKRILKSGCVKELPEIVIGTEVPLKSLVFKGPGDYLYEIMEFTDPTLKEIF